MDEIRSVDELIDLIGGTAAAASKLGVTMPAVSNWRKRGFIPAEYFAAFSEEARTRGRGLGFSLFGFSTSEASA